MEPWRSTHCRNWHIWLCLRCHSFYHWSIWQSSPSNSFSFANLYVSRVKLWRSRQGISSHLRGFQIMVPLPWRNFDSNWHYHRSQESWIFFCPSKLGTKPDMLTRWWDVYPKKGERNYTAVNPHIFTSIGTMHNYLLSIQSLPIHITTLYPFHFPYPSRQLMHCSTRESKAKGWLIVYETSVKCWIELNGDKGETSRKDWS